MSLSLVIYICHAKETLLKTFIKIETFKIFKLSYGRHGKSQGCTKSKDDWRSILRTNDKRTRGGHHIYQPVAPQQVYKYSFYPRTIQEWNRLPATTTDSPTLEEFTAAIQATDAAVFVAP